MGASFDSRTFKLNNSTKDEWNGEVESSQCSDGNEYSGCIGMLGKGYVTANHIANSQNDAIDFLEENHSKWDGALGVRFNYKGGTNKSDERKKAKLEKLAETASSNYDTLLNKIVSSFKNRKSKFVGCTSCGSKSQ